MTNNFNSKNTYIAPFCEIVMLSSEDIMSASGYWISDRPTTKGLEDIDHAVSGWWGA